MATPAQKRLVQKRLADIRHANNARLNWTGFAGKTLWDWLQLLGVFAIPLVIAGATLLFSIQQAHLADLQHLSDLKIADDQQQEATLKAYLDDMTTLLLDKKLGSQVVADKAASAEAAVVARAKTLVALHRLSAERKATVMQFLYEAGLIGHCDNTINCLKPIAPIIFMIGAELSGADLEGAVLDGAELVGANLSGADLECAELNNTFLSGVILNGADMVDAYLVSADLFGANLSDANLSGADLSGANLNGADLGGAILSGADLTEANLTGAQYTDEQLAKAKSLKGTIMRDGRKHA